LSHEFDFSGSCDVIGHVTIRFPICHFLLVVLWNEVSKPSRSRDIALPVYWSHEFDLSGSRDVIGRDHLIPRAHFLLVVVLEPSLFV